MGARKGVLAGAVGAVVAIAMLLGAAQASALVFWAVTGGNANGTSIGRADLDGGNADNFFIGGQDHPCGIAIDNEHIYWGTRGDFPVGAIARADLDGSNVDPHFIDAGFSPCGVAVDDEHVYWADFDNGGGDTIGRADIDGSNPDPDFITTAAGASVCGLAVDQSHIYWGTTYSTGDVGRANLDGTGIDNHFVAEAEHSCGVAVNASHLFWGDLSGSYGQGSVGRANLDGTGANIDFIPNSTGVGSPCGIAVDDEHVYWGDLGAQTGPGKVGRANLDGSDVDASFITTHLAGCGVAVNDLPSPPPVCEDGEADAVAGRRTPVELVCSGTGTLAYELVDPPAHGTVEDFDAANGTLQYKPDAGFSGDDSLSFRASNDVGSSNAAALSFHVISPNNFKIGKLTRDKKRGTGALAVRVPAAGRVVLRGNGVKRQVKQAAEARGLKLRVRAGGKKARTLRKRGKVTVRVKVTFEPRGGEARTKAKRVKLVKKAKKRGGGR